jgi:hypothetical protein
VIEKTETRDVRAYKFFSNYNYIVKFLKKL